MPATDLPFSGVFFDMDGTLINTEPSWQAAEVDIMASFGLGWTEENRVACHGQSEPHVTKYMAGLIAASGQQPPTREELIESFETFMLAEIAGDGLEILPGARELVAEVHVTGVPTALVSNSPRILINEVLKKFGGDWFDAIVSGNDVEYHKPDRDPYVRAARELGVEPNQGLAIEDSPAGVASAHAAEMFVVALNYLAEFPQAPRQHVVRSLEGVTLANLVGWYDPPEEVS